MVRRNDVNTGAAEGRCHGWFDVITDPMKQPNLRKRTLFGWCVGLVP